MFIATKNQPVEGLRPNHPKSSFGIVIIKPSHGYAEKSRRQSKKHPIADERLARNAGIGHAQYCERQHSDVRQLPNPEPYFARLVQGTRRIMCLFRFAHRQFPILYREGALIVRWMHSYMFRACGPFPSTAYTRFADTE